MLKELVLKSNIAEIISPNKGINFEVLLINCFHKLCGVSFAMFFGILVINTAPIFKYKMANSI